ncbi:hypothetical protein MT418_005300 [Batrachochytrium dendrobatidis]
MNNTHATLLDNSKPGSLPALPRSVNVCAIPVGEPTPAISTTVTTSISSEPKDAKTARPIESAIRCIEESIMPNDAEALSETKESSARSSITYETQSQHHSSMALNSSQTLSSSPEKVVNQNLATEEKSISLDEHNQNLFDQHIDFSSDQVQPPHEQDFIELAGDESTSLGKIDLLDKNGSDQELDNSDLLTDSKSDDDLSDISDSEIFQGYNFNASDNNMYAINAADLSSSTLDQLNPEIDPIQEAQILEKYYRHGALSIFKGKDQMQAMKSRLKLKSEIQQTRNEILYMEHRIHEMQSVLADTKESRQQSRADLDKIAKELEDIIQTATHVLVNIPCHQQLESMNTLPSTTVNSSKTSLERAIDIRHIVPFNPKLMGNQRYRMLRDHYQLHAQCISDAKHTISEVEGYLTSAQNDLVEFKRHQLELKPFEIQLSQEEVQEYIEMRIISKHRAQRAKRKVRLQMAKAAKSKQEKAEKLTADCERLYQQENEQEKQTKLMQKRFAQSNAKIEAEKSRLIDEDAQEQLKKQKALEILSKRINKIRQHTEIAKQNKANTLNAVDSSTSISETAAKESYAIQQIKKNILFKQTKSHEQQRMVRVEQEAKKMTILKKLIDEEDRYRKSKISVQTKPDSSKLFKEKHFGQPRQGVSDEKYFKSLKLDSINFNAAVSRPHSRLQDVFENPKDPLADIDQSNIHHTAVVMNKPDYQTKKSYSNHEQHTVLCDSHLSIPVSNISKMTQNRYPPPQMKNYKPNKHEPHLPKGVLGFCASPSEFIFRDYDSEQVYMAKATITNVSGRINSFKLLSIPIEISSLFDVQFSPPGKLCAGTSCDVKIVFRPSFGFDQDMPLTKIYFESEVGENFSVSVGCCTRKCRPVIASVGGGEYAKTVQFYEKIGNGNSNTGNAKMDTNKLIEQTSFSYKQKTVAVMKDENSIELDLGSCVVGSQQSACIDLANFGAISVGYQIMHVQSYKESLCLKTGTTHSLSTVNSNCKSSVPDSGELDNQKNAILLASVNNVSTQSSLEKTLAQVTKKTKSEHLYDSNGLPMDTPTSQSVSNTDTNWIETDGVFHVHGKECVLPGYQSHIINVDFKPPYVSILYSESNTKLLDNTNSIPTGNKSTFTFVIKFENPTIKPIFITCNAKSIPAPIMIDKNLFDFKICVVDGIYRDKIMVRNHNNISLKFWFEVDNNQLRHIPDSKPVKIPNLGEIEISPAMAFAQPFEPFFVWLTIKPLYDSCGAAMDASGKLPFNVPLLLKYVETTTRVEQSISLKLVGTITNNDIRLESIDKSRLLNFGAISTLETKQLPLVITNPSALPQSIRFIKFTDAFSVVPLETEDGSEDIISLNPLQSITRMVKFEPTEEAEYDIKLTCQSTWSRKFDIRCNGIGVKPLAQFEFSQISFSPCAFGSRRQTRVRLIQQLGVDKMRFKRSSNKLSSRACNVLDHTIENSPSNDVLFEFGTPIVIGVSDQKAVFQSTDSIGQQRTSAPDSVLSAIQDSKVGALQPHSLSNSSAAIGLNPSVRTAVESTFLPHAIPIIPDKDIDSLLHDTSLIHNTISAKESCQHLKLYHVLTPQDPQILTIWPQSGKLKPMSSHSIEVVLKPCLPRSKWHLSISANPLTQQQTEGNQSIKPHSNTSQLPAEGSLISASSLSKTKPLPTDKPTKPAKETKEASKLSKSTAVNQFPSSTKLKPLASTNEIFNGDSEFVNRLVEMESPIITMLVPCYLFPTTSEQSRIDQFIDGVSITAPAAEPNDPSGHSIKKVDGASVIYLKVIAPLHQPDLVLVEPPQGEEYDWGCIAVGEKEYADITVKNVSNQNLKVSASGLNPFGPFRIINYLRDLLPGQVGNIKVAFEPKDSLRCSASLELFSGKSLIKCKLVGKGAVSIVTLDPPDGVINMDDTCVGDVSTKVLKITNKSVIPIDFVLSLSTVRRVVNYETDVLSDMIGSNGLPLLRYGAINYSGTNAFSLFPMRFTVAPGTTQDVTIKFSPDRESDLFFDHINISYTGAREKTLVRVNGKAWEVTTAVIGYDPHPVEAREKNNIPAPKTAMEVAYRKLQGNSTELFKGTYVMADEVMKAGDEIMGNVMQHVSRKDFRFVTITFPWKLTIPEDSTTSKPVWRIEPHPLVIANLKPILTKLEFGKRSPVAEYTIEKYEGSFKFDADLNHYIVCRSPCTFNNESYISFGIETMKGTIDMGQTKSLKVLVNNSVKEYWESYIKMWERCKNINIDSNLPFDTLIPASTTNINKEKARLVAGNNASVTTTLPKKDEKESIRIQKLKKCAANPETITDPVEIVSTLVNDDIADLRKEAAKHEITHPFHVETTYKITIKGGYRLVEPKGAVFATESRVWLVKIQAEMPVNTTQ